MSHYTVPHEEASEEEILAFARTFNAHVDYDGPPPLSDLAQGVTGEWQRTGRLPNDLLLLRICLSYEEAAHYYEGGLAPFDSEYVRALVRRIRGIAGGAVPAELPHP